MLVYSKHYHCYSTSFPSLSVTLSLVPVSMKPLNVLWLADCWDSSTALSAFSEMSHPFNITASYNTLLTQLNQALSVFCTCLGRELFKWGRLWFVGYVPRNKLKTTIGVFQGDFFQHTFFILKQQHLTPKNVQHNKRHNRSSLMPHMCVFGVCTPSTLLPL